MYSIESRRHSAINVYFIYELMAQLSVTYHLCPSSLLGLAGPQGSWLWLKCKRTGSPCKHNSGWLLISHWLKQHSHGPLSICVCAGLQYYVAKACYTEGWRSSQSFTLHILLMNTSDNCYQYIFICLFAADSPSFPFLLLRV